MNILIVDDVQENIDSLIALMDAYFPNEVNVLTALNGIYALDVVNKNNIDLVLSDIQMPEMDGFELASILKSRKSTRDIPIIFVTAIFDSIEYKRKGFELGAVDYITKPIDQVLFVARINVYINMFKAYRKIKENELALTAANEKLDALLSNKTSEVLGYHTENTNLVDSIKQIKQNHTINLHNERLATIGAMSAGVAHEINNPINGILLNVKYVMRKTTDPKAMDALQQSVHELNRVAKIVQGLLSFSRKEQNTEVSQFDLLTLLKEIEYLAQSHLRSQGVQLVSRIMHEMPLVQANADAIKQILLNLMVNAAQAMKGKVDHPQVDMDAYVFASENRVLLRITDNGPGIPEELSKKIFDPFFTTKVSGEGTGLGLSLAANMAKDFGGALLLDEDYKKGARFLLYIPLAEDNGQQANFNIVDLQGLKELKILLGDDAKELIDAYLNELNDDVVLINNYYHDKAWSLLLRKSHQLKGSSLSVRASGIAQTCMEIEQMIKQHKQDDDALSVLINKLSMVARESYEVLTSFVR